jgi:integrase
VHDTEPRRFESGPAREVFSKKTTRGSDTSPRRSTPNSYKQRRRLKSRPLAEKIILSVHTGLRRGSLFHLRWDQVDFLNRVLRIPQTKSGRPHAVPLNATVLTTRGSHLRARKGQQKGNVPLRAWGDRRKWWNFRKEVARRTGRFPQLIREAA